MKICIACVLLLAWTSARADLVEIQWDDAGQFVHKTSVPATDNLEVCGRFDEGQQIDWRFSATAPLDFNIHYHTEDDTVLPAKQDAVTSMEDRLVTLVEQGYCWMWSNGSEQSVELEVELQLISD